MPSFLAPYLLKLRQWFSAARQRGRTNLGLDGLPLQIAANTSLTPSQQWVLAVGALYGAWEGAQLNAMRQGLPLASMREGLNNYWGISDRESYFEMEGQLSKLTSQDAYEAVWVEIRNSMLGYERLYKPHPLSIEHVLRYLGSFSHLLLIERFRARKAMKTLHSNEVEINGSLLPEKFKTRKYWFIPLHTMGIDVVQINKLAIWDVARFIGISRNAHDLGWITEKEFFELCTPAAQLAQRTYSSWAELIGSHFVACMLWSYEPERYTGLFAAHQRLVNEPDSPLRVLSWNTPLQT